MICLNEFMQMLILFLLISIIFKEKMTEDIRRWFICILSIIVFIFIFLFFPNKQAEAFEDLLISCVIIMCLLNECWYEKVASFLLLYSIPALMTQCISFIWEYMIGRQLFVGHIDSVTDIISEIILSIILTLVSFLIHKSKFTIQVSLYSKILLFIVSTLFSVVIALMSFKIGTIENEITLLLAVCGILTVVISIWLIILDSIRKNEEIKIQINEQYLNEVTVLYNEQINKEKEIRGIKHDLNNHLHAIRIFIDKKKYNEVNRYIDELINDTPNMTPAIKNTGNILVNSIILDKTIMAEKYGININCKGSLSNNLGISDVDACIFFSNLLSNAIEYVIKNNQFNKITVELFQDDSILIIRIINPVTSNFKIENAIQTTSKNDKECHGFGITNAKNAIKKYNGCLNFYMEDCYFVAEVIIY